VASLAAWLSWRSLAIPYAEAAIERATGYKALIGSLYPGLTTLRARDVVLLGAPPFQSVPLARIEALDVRLGGAGAGFWAPAAVRARGLKVTYLRVGALDNVRGQGSGRRRGPARPGATRPTLSVRDAQVEAFIRGSAKGGTFSVRAGPVSADVAADGALAAEIAGARLERAGWGSLSAGQLRLGTRGARRSLSAAVVSLAGSDGQVIHGHLLGGATMESGKIRLWLRSVAGDRAPLSAWGETSVEGSRGGLETSSLPLAGLGPLLAGVGVDARTAILGGRVAVDRDPGGPVAVQMTLGISGLALAHPRLDRQPWAGLNLKLSGTATVWTDGSRLGLDEMQVEAFGLPLAIRGFVERGPAPRGQWRLETPAAVSCPALLAGQPAPVRQALAGLKLGGQLGLRVGLAFDATAWDETQLTVAVDPLCAVEAEPDALRALMAGAGGALVSAAARGLPLDGAHPDFVTLKALPPALAGAFLTAEDARFFDHPGFDLENIRRALAHDLQVGDFARGASTITQQLAKNLFLGPERTLGRKLEEVVLAWRLHQRLGKNRTLELYLNIVELGPGIRGVKRAAEVYFGRPVTTLSPLEAAHLAALTPNPAGFARRFRDGKVDESWLRKLYDLLGMMNRSGRLSRAELAAARRSRLVLRRI
jgi:hypothetical protein